MRRWIVPLLMVAAHVLDAQPVTGTWQGTLAGSPRSSRLLLQVSSEGDGRLTAALFNLDQGGFGAPSVAFAASLESRALKARFARGSYDGTVNADGSSITGSWTPSGPGATGSQPLNFVRPTTSTAWRDSSAHRVRFISVERNVQLEVLDWGGSGRPVVLLAGLGNNAHVFDDFAPRLTDRYHVYGITRRGFAPSSVPTSGYLADSLADDVLAVVDSLHLERPVLVGHSLAGQELSSIGSRRAERVAGLVYLDAGYPYAFYDSAQDNAPYVIPDVQRRLAVIFDRWAAISFAERAAMMRELADTTLPILARDLRVWAKRLDAAANPTVRPPVVPRDPVASAIFGGEQRYTKIRGPVLAIFAWPRPLPPSVASDSVAAAKADSAGLAGVMPQITAFQRGVPQARVIRIPHSTHYVFLSNPVDVLQEVHAFVDALPGTP
jgi:pimeloyl-ACP methyl ester carboxylesterase